MGASELELLKLLGTRDTFKRYHKYVQPSSLSKHPRIIFDHLAEYWSTLDKDSIDWSDYKTWLITTKVAAKKEAEKELLRIVCDNISAATLSTTTQEVIRHFIVKSYISEMDAELMKLKIGDPSSSIDNIGLLVTRCNNEIGSGLTLGDVFVELDLDTKAKSYLHGGLEWRLEELNLSVGPLRHGNFVIVGARPEIGKTTFLASEVANWLHQMPGLGMTGPIVWVNNEEESSEVQMRVIQAILGWSSAACYADPVRTREALYLACPDFDKRLLITRNDVANDVKTLDHLFEEHKPSIICFDQLDKVLGFNKEDREDLRLGKIYQWARNISHRWGVVVAMSQASEAAEGQQYFGYNLLRGSKTDKGGEGDCIICIGADNPPTNQRYISVSKNKLPGSGRTDPSMKHARFPVTILPEVARYTSVLTTRRT